MRLVSTLLTLGLLSFMARSDAAPNFADTIARPLRYQPRGTDFVAIDGKETFNRPLYGSGTPFRVDAGDKPEFSLFLPGRGGVLRLGVKRGDRAIWLIDAQSVEARYRPGSMLYTIEDPILGDGELRVTVMASFVDEALLAKVELRSNVEAVELIAAFGGANGDRGSRNGDIGTEKLPVREFFQLKPEHCKDNRFDLAARGFALTSKASVLIGRSQPPMTWSIADAAKWSSPVDLLGSKQTDTPVIVGRAPLAPGEPIFLRIDRRPLPSTQPGATQPAPIADSDLDADFAESELLRGQIADRVKVDTPDPFINAAVSAVNVAAEGTWDSKERAVMHGAVAWRVKLLGWRGPYWLDALGVHDRLPMHLDQWFEKQNVDPIPNGLPAPEASANHSRNETALHSNGNLTDNHYDMNLVAIDAFFRHVLWTGDKEYAKKCWPVIERHLAWERRLFRREFGPEKLPLYEGYACIWASDDLSYNGGGAAHSSAYNAFHNRMAARVAKWIGRDPAPYVREADAIERAMRELLWLKEGHYAESKDYLGEQLVHPDAAAWSVYHVIDSQITTPAEAWQLADYAATALPRFPIEGENVPPGTFQIASSDWFPYQWSTNNVVMAESAHTALAMFQANRSTDAFALLKGCILDSMYMGQCPGNVGMTTPLDMARGESQRDFADGCGALSRAIVEGLFGIEPDAIDGGLTLSPRFPRNWKHASIHHPDLDFTYASEDNVDRYSIDSRFSKADTVHLIVPAKRDRIEQVTVGNRSVNTFSVTNSPSGPQAIIELPSSHSVQHIQIHWAGNPIAPPAMPAKPVRLPATSQALAIDWNVPFPADTKLDVVDLSKQFNASVTAIFRNQYLSPRSPFASLAVPKQGIGSWCKPATKFDVDDTGLRELSAKGEGIITLPNGIRFATPSEPQSKNTVFVSQWDNYPKSIDVPLQGFASRAYFLMAGSTNSMQSHFDNGEIVVTYADDSTARLALRNPETWWPIDQDYAIDDFAFRYDGAVPPRIDLKTGNIRIQTLTQARGKGRVIEGGAATVLDLSLDPTRRLKSLTVEAKANEVVIGLMGITLMRPDDLPPPP